MARQRKSKQPSSASSPPPSAAAATTSSADTPSTAAAAAIPLSMPQPGDPTEETLLDIAERRKLDKLARSAEIKKRLSKPAARASRDDVLSQTESRVAETALWTATLAMVHFMFDTLAQHQYGTDIDFQSVVFRTVKAWVVFFALFYVIHPHESNDQALLPAGILPNHQHAIRQALFFAASLAAGCYMIYVTNERGYLAVMKQTPPLACVWLWSVAEMDLPLATASLAVDAAYIWSCGFSIK